MACSLGDEPWIAEFVRAVYDANFARDLDIGSRDVVARCVAEVGQRPEPILEAAGSEDAKQRLRARTDEAVRRGVFGAPTFAVGDELFWGNDRLADALRWHRDHPGA